MSLTVVQHLHTCCWLSACNGQMQMNTFTLYHKFDLHYKQLLVVLILIIEPICLNREYIYILVLSIEKKKKTN